MMNQIHILLTIHLFVRINRNGKKKYNDDSCNLIGYANCDFIGDPSPFFACAASNNVPIDETIANEL